MRHPPSHGCAERCRCAERTIFQTSGCLSGKITLRSRFFCRIGSFASAARDSSVAQRACTEAAAVSCAGGWQ